MKLYTVLFALFLFNIAYVFAGENLAIEKSELSRRIMKRYLEKDSVQKMEKRLQATTRCPYIGCLNDDK